jgi:hypothetical protein
MTPRVIAIGTVTALVFAGACSSGGKGATHLVQVADPAPTGPLLLAQFDTGIGAVSEEASTPAWTEPGAVAAPDGSAVFSIRAGELVRIDPRTGAASSSWPLPPGVISISAVAPAGRWIALTDRTWGYGNQARTSTTVVVFDTRAGAEARRMPLAGDVQPEAFSVDGSLMFALDYRVGYYRVQTIELATGRRFDTTDRDKTLPPEDMHGQSVHGVMSADDALLATLYRNPEDADEPSFVHVLDLAHGWSYCADLPAPFGTGPLGTDTIELTQAGTVVVAATRFDRLAEIHIDDVRTADTSPVRLELRAGTGARPSETVQSMPGFEYVIAPLDA